MMIPFCVQKGTLFENKGRLIVRRPMKVHFQYSSNNETIIIRKIDQ